MISFHTLIARGYVLAVALITALPASALEAQAAQGGLVDRLVASLEKREGDSFWATVGRIEALGKDAVPTLTARLRSGSDRTRLGCATALLEVGDSDAQDAALAALAELAKRAEDRETRIHAIEIFGAEGDPDEVLDVLKPLFEKTLDPQIMIPLARTLWEVDHVKEARDRLVDLLDSRDLQVRAEAALTLAEIGYFEGPVRDVIRDLRTQPTPRGRRAALLDRILRLSRQLDRGLDEGDVLLGGTDAKKLLKIKEKRIRELEDRLERAGKTTGQGGGGRPRTQVEELFEEVIELIQQVYVDEFKTTRDKLILSAISGMTRGLDQHSLFMDVKESQDFARSLDGNYPGIGAHVAKRPKEYLEVVRPIYGGPAYDQGIQSGDKIIAVDGVDTVELGLDEIMKLLKGPTGTTVKLDIWRRGWTENRELEIERRTIEVPSVLFEALPEGIGYIRLTQFGIKSADEFETALDTLEEAGLEGLVVDLRDNPGGRLPIAVRIADLFVRGELPIVSQKGRGGEDEVPPYFPTDEARTGYPIVVLVNENSASASEIVSGALQDFGRAKLVGTRTYGKGSVQNIIPLKTREGSQLKLTVQYYFLPLGRCIHTRRDASGRIVEPGGVEPDVLVSPERLQAWHYEERLNLSRRTEVLDYVDKHFETLESLIPIGDRGVATRYPEFSDLFTKLGTAASEDDLRSVIRLKVQRRLEDRRGRQYAVNLQEDRVLQVGIFELLASLNRPLQKSENYRWIEAPKKAEKPADAKEKP